MQQVLLEGPRRVRIADAAAPTPSSNELLVEVKATAICGTDVHIYAGDMKITYPRVPGHEVAGIVREIGNEVSAFSAGDAVVVNPNLDCNSSFEEDQAAANLWGHGLGLAQYDTPVVSRIYSLDNPVEIQPGMSFALETQHGKPLQWGVRVEEMMIVTETGPEITTQFPIEEITVID